jgi:hypothetical protein
VRRTIRRGATIARDGQISATAGGQLITPKNA